jgi:predicted ATPase
MQIRSKRPVPATILIEQPELHLHPSMQANLADLFIDAISTKSKLQIIAETHSESLLLRVQKRIREGRLDPSDVQVLFVDKGKTGNQVTEVKLDADDDFSLTLPLSFSQLRLQDLL